MATTLQDIMYEFSKAEKNWSFAMNGFRQMEPLGGDLLESEIKILGAKTNIKETAEKIEKVKDLLGLNSNINLEQRDIDNIYNHMGRIAHSSGRLQKELGETVLSSNFSHVRIKAGGIISYLDEDDARVNFNIRDYIEPISNGLDKVISIFTKYIHFAPEDSNYPSPKETSDNEKIKDLKIIIEGLQEKIGDFLSNENTTKKQREEEIKEIREIKESVETARGQIIVSDITKALLDKENKSFLSLKVATTFYLIILACFFAYVAILVFNSFGWEFLELKENFWENVGLRSLLLSPYFLVIVFSSQYYNRAFRRSEYFASKYIIASLVEGFKDQAKDEEYKDAIASTVFSELLLDPADYLDRMEKRKKEKESVIASLIDKIKGEGKEDTDAKATLIASLIDKIKSEATEAITEQVKDELEKTTAKKTTPPTPE